MARRRSRGGWRFSGCQSGRSKRGSESFWWMSLFGGVMLFSYFVWRQDLSGGIGQTSGWYLREEHTADLRSVVEAAAAAAGTVGLGSGKTRPRHADMGTGRGSTAS